MSILRKAAQFAIEAHRDQRRSHSGDPYIVHIFRVAAMASEFGLPLYAQVGLILHDTVEDCDVTIGDIIYEFGAEVGDVVWGLTNVEGRGEMTPGIDNRLKRKAADRDFLSKQSVIVRTAKFIDCIDNMKDRPDASFVFRLLDELRALAHAIHRPAGDVGMPSDVDAGVLAAFWEAWHELNDEHEARERAKNEG